MSFLIYADGACRRNPGPGGWGAVVLDTDKKTVYELGSHAEHTTNNRMEIEAASSALASLEKIPGDITFYLDSTYVIQGVTQWVYGWSRNGWQTSNGTSVVNKDLWEVLYKRVQERQKISKIYWKHILGHAGIPGNERADEIAQAFSNRKKITLYNGSSSKYGLDLVNIPEPDLNKKKLSKSRSGKKSVCLSKPRRWSSCSSPNMGRMRSKSKGSCESKVQKSSFC